jgi:antitoxin ParD1/3/4
MHPMSTMNISLPDSLKAFVDEQVAERGFGSISEYVRELIRREQDRSQLRTTFLEAEASPVVADMGSAYFAQLRERIRKPSRR